LFFFQPEIVHGTHDYMCICLLKGLEGSYFTFFWLILGNLFGKSCLYIQADFVELFDGKEFMYSFFG
jgi:hypothetical protein